MEIKTLGAIPLWFSQVLNDNQIYPTSFSKYGTEYKMYYINKKKEKQNA